MVIKTLIVQLYYEYDIKLSRLDAFEWSYYATRFTIPNLVNIRAYCGSTSADRWFYSEVFGMDNRVFFFEVVLCTYRFIVVIICMFFPGIIYHCFFFVS